jgi:thiol:disulfide interchange protein
MTPKPKSEFRRRSSLIKSTKAQRARAEAIALKQDRLSIACNNAQSNFPKSPLPAAHRSKENRSSSVTFASKTSNTFQRSVSTSRATMGSSTPCVMKKTKTVPSSSSTRISMTTPVPDRIARIQEAKQKANNFLRSNSKSATKVPNFQKLHAQSFKNQKSITTVVKEVSFRCCLPCLNHFLLEQRDPIQDDRRDEDGAPHS